MYPNNDPISFISGFYGCLQAGVVPVPVEVPSSRRVYYFVTSMKFRSLVHFNHILPFLMTYWI